jgi:excinuclease ABC subunit B
VAEEATDYGALSPEQVGSTIKKLEARMYKHAQNLEFEEAGKLRDEIHRLREKALR